MQHSLVIAIVRHMHVENEDGHASRTQQAQQMREQLDPRIRKASRRELGVAAKEPIVRIREHEVQRFGELWQDAVEIVVDDLQALMHDKGLRLSHVAVVSADYPAVVQSTAGHHWYVIGNVASTTV